MIIAEAPDGRKAVFSDDRHYRYHLHIPIDQGLLGGCNGAIAFLMLNPSTATELVNDPTIDRCYARAKAWHFAALQIINLFALRSTDPAALYAHAAGKGPEPTGGRMNDEAIVKVATGCQMLVCGWGRHGSYLGRAAGVLSMLRTAGAKPHYLRINDDGTPAHPLYLPYELSPLPLW